MAFAKKYAVSHVRTGYLIGVYGIEESESVCRMNDWYNALEKEYSVMAYMQRVRPQEVNVEELS